MWCGRPDSVPCCGGPLGAVDDGESVARLLHSRILDPDRAAFTRKELTGEGVDAPSNTCGDADGCSVDRVDGLSDGDVLVRSEVNAARRPGRDAAGAIVAAVSKLRSIRHELAANDQAVLVYDDPRADNERHAVIRLCTRIPRADFKMLQRKVIEAFDRRV